MVDALVWGQIIPAVVHHVSKKYDRVRTRRLCGSPGLSQVEVDDVLAERHEPRITARIRIVIEDLRIRNNKDTSGPRTLDDAYLPSTFRHFRAKMRDARSGEQARAMCR